MTLTLTKLPTGRDEPDLVAAARAGDDRAFEQLYARYRARIFSFILARVHDHGKAEDIAQDVFIAALRRLRASEGDIAFKPWIYEIAKNACIDEFRRGARARETPLEADGQITVDRGSIAGTVPTPPSVIEGRQRLDDLRGAFGGLSDAHRRLLLLREFEGLSYDEIGQRLEMSRQMVESSLFRARRKLAEEYQELASGRRCLQVQAAIDAGELQSARALGLRSRRLFARHLSHCQPCRHVALVAGVDDALVQRRGIAAKVAGLLPFGLGRWVLRHWGGGGSVSARTGTAAAHAAGPSVGLGPAAAGVAALAIAGAGAGIIQGVGTGRAAGHPSLRLAPTAAHMATHAGSGSATAGRSAPIAARATRHPAGAHGKASRRAASFVLSSGTRTGAPAGARRPGSHRRPAGGSGTSGGAGSAPSAGGKALGGGGSATGGNPVPSAVALHPARTISAAVGSVLTSAGQTVSNTVSNTTQALSSGVSSVANTVSNTVSKTVQTASGTVAGTLSTVTQTAAGVDPAVSSAAGALTGSGTSGSGTSGSGAPASPAGSASGAVSSAASTVTSAVSQTASDILGHS